MGTLYYGDNLDILRRNLKDDTVDLVYLDPPFNSAQSYNAFFHEKDGTDAALDETFKKAPRAKAKGHEQTGLDLK
jgi:16S rRNA G966 N2-methylase RsmD